MRASPGGPGGLLAGHEEPIGVIWAVDGDDELGVFHAFEVHRGARR